MMAMEKRTRQFIEAQLERGICCSAAAEIPSIRNSLA
jgi:hypothetical protein